ncbi:aspartyl protease AED1 [Setaria viridis]|nr:aspartyl protease AED1-like [Setaria viridis]
MASHRSLVRLLVLCVLCVASLASKQRYLSVSLDELLSSKAHVDCPPTKKSGRANGNKLPLMHRDSPCSPLNGAGKISRQALPTDVFERDVQRLRTIFAAAQSGVADTTAAAPAPAPASGVTLPITGSDNGIVLGSQDYSVTVGYGTPAQQLPMDFDTLRLGGGISTLRCKPCRAGAAPCDPAFDPGRSSTFARVPCGPECPSVCDGSACSLNITFPRNHSVAANGTFVKDTLTLSPSATVASFILACVDVDNFHITGSSGLLDLSRSRFSLVSRLTSSPAGNTTAAFSYCLPASPTSSRGFLSIGGALPELSSDHAASTPLVDTPNHKNLYLVKLGGINVSDTEIPAAQSNLAALEVGTSFTFFPPAIYGALRDEFRKQMSQYPMAPPYRMLETCYNFTGLPGFFMPAITLAFDGGATLQPDVAQMLYFVEPGYVCLAFAALPEVFPYSVIGNRVQQTVEVVYDVRGGKIGFIQGSC